MQVRSRRDEKGQASHISEYLGGDANLYPHTLYLVGRFHRKAKYIHLPEKLYLLC